MLLRRVVRVKFRNEACTSYGCAGVAKGRNPQLTRFVGGVNRPLTWKPDSSPDRAIRPSESLANFRQVPTYLVRKDEQAWWSKSRDRQIARPLPRSPVAR